jgi:hypothetical protein
MKAPMTQESRGFFNLVFLVRGKPRRQCEWRLDSESRSSLAVQNDGIFSNGACSRVIYFKQVHIFTSFRQA